MLINVYYIKHSDIDLNPFIPFLSMYRKEKINNAMSKSYIQEQVFGEFFLLYILATKGINIKPPLTIKETAEGKPHIDDLGLKYSISHHKTHFIIAVNSDEVGVDIEDNKRILKGFERRILHQNEVFHFNHLKDKNTYLLKTWVIKESILKLAALGLKGIMKSIDTTANLIHYKNRDVYYKTYEVENLFISIASYKNKDINFEIVKENSLVTYLKTIH